MSRIAFLLPLLSAVSAALIVCPKAGQSAPAPLVQKHFTKGMLTGAIKG